MKIKRTYHLTPEAIATVRRLVEQGQAPSQDALVEQAIQEYARLLQDAADAIHWARAASDADFREEVGILDACFSTDDIHAWDA
jgi:hypothetical protein